MRLHSLFFLALPLFALASESEQMAFTGNRVGEEYSPTINTLPTLADLLTIESSASIFYSYARETRLSNLFIEEGGATTLLVPTNKAVMALARKPHQSQESTDTGIEVSEEEFDKTSRQNIERWISTHIIPESPLDFSKSYSTLLDEQTVSFKPLQVNDPSVPEWSRVVLNDNIHIVGMKQGANGVIYLLDGTIKYD